MYKFKFADIGEGLHEGVVAEIYKNIGDVVKEGDPLFSVETDKVTSDIPSPADGKIVEVLMKEGDTINVGDEIYHIDDGTGIDEKADVKESSASSDEPKIIEEKEEPAPSVVGSLEQSNDLLDFSKFSNQNTKTPETPLKSVDLIIIGSGPGGYLAAEIAGKHGLKTIIAEKDSPGGVCLNVGCIPTKALLHSAKMYHSLKPENLGGLSIKNGEVEINWHSILKHKEDVVKKLVGGVGSILKAPNIELIKGYATIVDKNTVSINNIKYNTKHIIIATGSSPIKLPLKGFDKAREDNIIIDSTQALDLKEIPESLVVIGGGVIGLEFASLYNEFGTKVTILEGLSKIIPPCDDEISAYAAKLAKKAKIDIITNARVISYENGAIQYIHDGVTKSIKTAKVLESVGRRTNVDAIGNIGINLGKRKEIVVNEKMQTSIKHILAIGDVTGAAMLAHVAYAHAKIAVNTILGIDDKYMPFNVPAAIYTYPEISMIGRTEEQLKSENIDYLKVNIPNYILGKSIADGNTEGFTKLLFSKKYGEILGCHMINFNASDIISEVAVIMEMEGTIFNLNKTIHPHPSISETLSECALKATFVWRKANNK